MVKDKNDLQRVFIHEMGHFVAGELNYRLFNYDRRIEEFKIVPRIGTKFYNGSVYDSKSKKDSYSVNTSANEYVQLFYGCLFEVLFRNIALNKCLCTSVSRENHSINNFGNGKVDANYIFYIGIRKEIKEFASTWYEFISGDFFEEMKSLNNHFEKAFIFDVNDYILKEFNHNSYLIDVTKLLESLSVFLEFHEPYFYSLVNKLQSIQGLNKNN